MSNNPYNDELDFLSRLGGYAILTTEVIVSGLVVVGVVGLLKRGIKDVIS